jgi:hypothetical protein
MRHPRFLLLLLFLLLPLPLTAQSAFSPPVPLEKVLTAIGQTYSGRLIAAEAQGEPDGAISYRIDLMSPQNSLIRVRYDAASGRFLSVEGRDLAAAARSPSRLIPPDAHSDR